MTPMEDAMSETMLEKAAIAVWNPKASGLRDDEVATMWRNQSEEDRRVYRAIARAVLMAVKELPGGFTRERQAQFYNTEFLDADFESVIDAILAQEPEG